MANDMLGKIGSWAFLIGIIVALIVGIYQGVTYESALEDAEGVVYSMNTEDVFFVTDTGATVAWVLAILGAIVGVLAFLGKGTITSKERVLSAFLLGFIFISFCLKAEYPAVLVKETGTRISDISSPDLKRDTSSLFFPSTTYTVSLSASKRSVISSFRSTRISSILDAAFILLQIT